MAGSMGKVAIYTKIAQLTLAAWRRWAWLGPGAACRENDDLGLLASQNPAQNQYVVVFKILRTCRDPPPSLERLPSLETSRGEMRGYFSCWDGA